MTSSYLHDLNSRLSLTQRETVGSGQKAHYHNSLLVSGRELNSSVCSTQQQTNNTFCQPCITAQLTVLDSISDKVLLQRLDGISQNSLQKIYQRVTNTMRKKLLILSACVLLSLSSACVPLSLTHRFPTDPTMVVSTDSPYSQKIWRKSDYEVKVQPTYQMSTQTDQMQTEY